MSPLELIDKYCPEERLHHILLTHSRAVADKALAIARSHPELGADEQFIEEAALLHDIGIVRVDAPAIACYGAEPYICHGILGAEILRGEGWERHALVCERHTGTGLTMQQIIAQQLPLPQRDMQPVSIEEQIICFADKFFSKTRLDSEKSVEQARRSLEKFGEEGLVKFDAWCERFLY
ncbi:MAG: HD domain-containing protein [Bacteroidaceae bacterium]|nr:HD domain-containing protein [Bacteroidaceae bacterium]